MTVSLVFGLALGCVQIGFAGLPTLGWSDPAKAPLQTTGLLGPVALTCTPLRVFPQ